MIALIDYRAGNLRSVEKALQSVGAQVVVTSRPEDVRVADQIVLPGVGAFGDGMAALHELGMVDAIFRAIDEKKPLLGICLGMQLLFERSEEMGEHAGLGVLPGAVLRFSEPGLKIPQIGWNQVWPDGEWPLLAGLEPGFFAYFNHSYYCDADPKHVMARTDYGLHYASVVGSGRIYGAQFHPEKSQLVGLNILRNFVERCR